MSGTEISQTEDMPEVTGDTVHLLIESFFKKITPEQWESLKSCTSDDATKIMVADLLLDIITLLSKVWLTNLRRKNAAAPEEWVFSEECVMSSLSDIFFRSFAGALNAEDQVECVSSQRLTGLVSKEVAESVKSALSTTMYTTEPVIIQHITPPHRLNAMVGHVCKMIKAFTAKIKTLCSAQTCMETSHTSPTQKTEQTPFQGEVTEDMEPEDTDDCIQSPVTTVEPEISENISSDDSVIEIPILTAVEEIIRKEVMAIIDPLLDQVPDFKYELIRSECSREIEDVAEDIARSITQIRSLDGAEAASPKCQLFVKAITSKIKSFFTMRLAKAWYYRILEDLKAKFHKESNVESEHSRQTAIESFDSLLQTEDNNKPQGRNVVNVIQKFKNMTLGKIKIFTQEFTDILYGEITLGMAPDLIPEPMRGKSCSNVNVPDSHADMYADMYAEIRNKVWNFMGLIGWWLNTQIDSHSNRVVNKILKESLAAPQLPKVNITEKPVATAPAPSSVCEETCAVPAVLIKIFTEKLVSRIYRKAKVNWSIGNPEANIYHLSNRTWDEVKGIHFATTQKTFKNLDKAIFQDLCKKWGCADEVLIFMRLEDPALEKCIASSVKDYLTTPPKKCNTICRFFLSVGKAISNICRRKARVMPV
ncbi:uncharacterized protein LOC118495494 [Sander lucioperca]|uniref:uncharacterized protein LOC118495494 n=1 Tax=Sander lucioperca TaxID=283035 RepID=UPI001653738E|nr:uncharacterized protein LOC118495494 [Sander lucioperca]